jgi:hypothetical protein
MYTNHYYMNLANYFGPKTASHNSSQVATPGGSIPILRSCSVPWCQIGAGLTNQSEKQILNMDQSGVTTRPSKGKRRKVGSLTTCPVDPHFQGIRDVSHVSVVGRVSNSLLFLTVSNIDCRDFELCTMLGDLQPSM